MHTLYCSEIIFLFAVRLLLPQPLATVRRTWVQILKANKKIDQQSILILFCSWSFVDLLWFLALYLLKTIAMNIQIHYNLQNRLICHPEDRLVNLVWRREHVGCLSLISLWSTVYQLFLICFHAQHKSCYVSFLSYKMSHNSFQNVLLQK